MSFIGCEGFAEDSIEHYCRCSVVKQFHAETLNIHEGWLLPGWCGAEPEMQEERLVLMAIGVFAVYTVTNEARHEGRFAQEQALNALGQACKEAVIGHQKSMQVLKKFGSPPRQGKVISRRSMQKQREG